MEPISCTCIALELHAAAEPSRIASSMLSLNLVCKANDQRDAEKVAPLSFRANQKHTPGRPVDSSSDQHGFSGWHRGPHRRKSECVPPGVPLSIEDARIRMSCTRGSEFTCPSRGTHVLYWPNCTNNAGSGKSLHTQPGCKRLRRADDNFKTGVSRLANEPNPVCMRSISFARSKLCSPKTLSYSWTAAASDNGRTRFSAIAIRATGSRAGQAASLGMGSRPPWRHACFFRTAP